MMDVTSAAWRKSSYSTGSGGECVEVADLPDGHAVRDTKDQSLGPILLFTRDDWHSFIAGVKAREFD